METKNKKKKITSKSLRVYAIIFLVVGAVYILSGIYSFFTTINGYVSQGYATSEVLMYLLPSQFLPTVIEPLAIFGGLALLLFGVSEVLSRLNSDDNEIVDEQEAAEEIEETEVIEDEKEEIKDEEVNVNEDAKEAEDNEEVIEDNSLEENVETADEETKEDVVETESEETEEVVENTESEESIEESTEEEMDEEDNLDKTLDKEDKSSDNDDEHDE